MRKLVSTAAVLLALGFGAAPAQALPIAGVSGPNNDIIGDGVPGWYNANLYLLGGSADIEIQYVGKEAGNTNTFYFDGNPIFTTNSNVGATSTIFGVSSGLLNFSFASSGANGGSVANGSNRPNGDPLTSFFMTFNQIKPDPISPNDPAGGQFVYLGFDDQNGASDDNHDDLVVRLRIVGNPGPTTFSAVPDNGSTLALLGIAMVGVAALRRSTLFG